MLKTKIYLTFPVFSVLFIVLNMLCSPYNRFLYIDKTNNIIDNRSQKALVLPINEIAVTYFDNTARNSDSIFSDSFFIETANSLLEFECKKYFSLLRDQRILKEYDTTISQLKKYQYSRLLENTQDLHNVSLIIRDLITAFRVDYLIIPYSCEIDHTTFQPKGWRTSQPYNQPVKHSVRTKTHLQIWNHEGVLMYERISIKKNRKPFLYSFLEKRNTTEDVVNFSKSIFAPPSLKSLSKTMASAMNISLK